MGIARGFMGKFLSKKGSKIKARPTRPRGPPGKHPFPPSPENFGVPPSRAEPVLSDFEKPQKSGMRLNTRKWLPPQKGGSKMRGLKKGPKKGPFFDHFWGHKL